MKLVKIAAGFAVGYVLGSRAGRDAYEKIATNARQLREHPTVRQAQDKATALLSTGTDAATAKLHQVAADTRPTPSAGPTTGSGSTADARPARDTVTPAVVRPTPKPVTPVQPAVGSPLS
ncbi:hypothetical protein Acy02nite_00450 [Actinoplanes cyaneus]|jgi:hypothetical protein|uniref:Protoporphyrinogen oxidase n=1 Tax=Actinoplanes cyaneus TaxID=52696 RepID=A0A919M4C1_9ACTN|nr:hypothetical protein [Actinoplanes cyaneus]MCW2142615.1 hypothetical protein [Actinoplanes cyaneus]GID62164.1 hypothetical protein Acy02nite_00450 [Actinoplanes cyaneus]